MRRMLLGVLLVTALLILAAPAAEAAPATSAPRQATVQPFELVDLLHGLLERLQRILPGAERATATVCENGHVIDPDGCPSLVRSPGTAKNGHVIDPDGNR